MFLDTTRKKKQQQSRQLLSCTKCRERKVKCDRTKPCSACCARGQPKECHFVAEGGDYGPIQQSYELRKLRAENLKLKEELRSGKFACSDDEDDAYSPVDAPYRNGGNTNSKVGSRQKKFKSQDAADSLYFGSPGLVNVVNDFANLSLSSSRSLAHTMPRPADIYATHAAHSYPFATMWPALPQACAEALVNCLPSRTELFEYLDSFQRRAPSCSFPHVLDEGTTKEVDRFLSDPRKNAELFPDMLALIFASLALGLQLGSRDRNDAQWIPESLEAEASRGDVYIAAALQALRMASFMSRPTLLAIQTLIIISPYLTNSGRFLDAWTLFGSTIRLAHSVGLHRNPRYLDPAPPLRECATRQSLWWWILHMDQQYSVTLGRPLGISGIGDCPPPEPLTTDPTILRFSEFVNQFTVLARQILSSDRLSNSKIDDFTDKLQSLWETLPEMLQFDESWLDEEKCVPEWPLNVMAGLYYGKLHNYIILLNRQRLENTQRSESPLASPTILHGHPQYPFPSTQNAQQYSPQYYHPQQYHQAYSNTYSASRSQSQQQYPPSQSSHSNQSPATTPSSSSPPTAQLQSTPVFRGRPAVVTSSIALLTAFVFYSKREPQALICWSICQGAFNASMILLLDAIETGPTESSHTNLRKVHVCWRVFKGLEEQGVHKLAALARRRVGEGLTRVQETWTARNADHKSGPRRDTGSVSTGSSSKAGGNSVKAVQGEGRVSYANGQGAADALGYGDAVMGNTGMLLLEDPGLQAFRPEGFVPLKWDMVGGDLGQMQEPSRDQGRRG